MDSGSRRDCPTEEDVERPSMASVLSMPGHLLRRCHQIAVGIFLEECRSKDLTPLQFVALATLAERGPLDQAALGRVAAFDRTTSATVIRALAERGLVIRRQSEEDKRAKIVTLTDAGEKLLQEAQLNVDSAQARIVSPLSARERAQLNRLLGKIADANNGFSRAPRFDA